MASSSGEEPRTSPIVADATPMVSMEAKMLVATGRDHCHQLRDMLNKADPSTMVVVMASGNQTSTPKPHSPVMDPRLLAAACSGSFQDLESLLNGKDRRASSDGTIGSSARQPTSGDEEAFLRESLLDMVTIGGDTALHVVAATHGDCGDSLNKAGLVHRKAKNLLFVQNNRGDTPLHCAARAGRFEMVSFLIDLAKGHDTNASRMKTLLEVANINKGTALHDAVCSGNNGIVKLLMTQHPELASFPQEGTSPLYLAILLQNKIIAKTLYELSGGVLSYSGPNRRNALHVAALQGKEFTKMLLEWNNDLILQHDENGSTPLHFAAAGKTSTYLKSKIESRASSQLLLEANPDALYQQDHNGSFPIHVAASIGEGWLIKFFLKKSPNCAGLRDARERTFLHVAILKMQENIVSYACKDRSLSWILNMKDSDGNTALHLVVQARSLPMFYCLLRNKQVDLNLTNEKGEAPRDIAFRNVPKRLHYILDDEAMMFNALVCAGALLGISCQAYLTENDIAQARKDEIHEMDRVKQGTESLCIGSALIATVTFGASFAMPGGYRADDHSNGGAPTLVGRYAFNAFTLANALAFSFSAMATISLTFSGSPMVRLQNRKKHLSNAYTLMLISVTSLVVAFALGIYTMLAPVAHKTAIAVCVMSSLILLYQNWEVAIKILNLIGSLWMRKYKKG